MQRVQLIAFLSAFFCRPRRNVWKVKTLCLLPYPATTYKVYRSFESSLSVDLYQVIYSQTHLPVVVFAYEARGYRLSGRTALRYTSPRAHLRLSSHKGSSKTFQMILDVFLLCTKSNKLTFLYSTFMTYFSPQTFHKGSSHEENLTQGPGDVI